MKNPFVFRLICYMAYLIGRLFWFTYRYKYTGVENLHQARRMHPNGSFVLACWHEFAVPGVLAQVGHPYYNLISSSKDGELIDFICRRIGQKTVRGSSTRGGLEARNRLISVIQEGNPIAITVDGPKGPRRKSKPGVVDMARQTGVPILPVAVASHHPWIFKKSWDQTKLPKFFSSVIFRYGEPIFVPPELSEEEFNRLLVKLEDSLNLQAERAQVDLLHWKELPSRREEIGIRSS